MDTLCKNNDNHRGLARRDKDSSGKGPYTLLCWPFLPKMEGNIRHFELLCEPLCGRPVMTHSGYGNGAKVLWAKRIGHSQAQGA
ncbi:hypothetical protein NQZ68_003056 [Dissostichus eleginoides]|nr:hypothetical protein NQZ68_003056 [Dissostichus eleginoides]